MERVYNWLLLKSIRGLGERSLKKLYQSFGSSEAILSAGLEGLQSVIGERKAVRVLKREGVDRNVLESVLKTVEREGITCITLEDRGYPQALLEIPDPPPLVFLRGELKPTELIGVVGSRKPTPYTLAFVDELVSSVVNAGFGVVSGGAQGVDSRAHISAIENSGYTVCILGFGVLKARGFPFEKIIESNGVLISEFLPYQSADRHTFPKRNRLIAALSKFLIIPEAGARSGSLITARYAAEYGKKIYVHIGVGKSPNWDGCYRLVRKGVAELVKDGGELFGSSASEEEELIRFLKVPRSFEEIREFLGVGSSELFTLLTRLEMEGKLRKIGSHYSA